MEEATRQDIKCEWWQHSDGRSQPFGYRIQSRANGRTLATPGESYSKKGHMLAMIRKLFGEIRIERVDAPGEVKR